MSAAGGLVAPAFIRGEIVTDNLVSFGGRGDTATFRTPDPASIIERLPLGPGDRLIDMHELTFEEIVDYLGELGSRLALGDNPYLQEALEYAVGWSDMTSPLLRASYEQLPTVFTREAVQEMAESSIGIPHVEGWVNQTMADGRTVAVRAVGARSAHIVAGNSPLVAAVSVIRNAIARSDAIVKAPSNDPLTALAIARTMSDMAPDHPITKHLSVAYWKGGDTAIEDALYRPANIEKIIAWGGFASVTHITRYIQPGLELIALDPKRSATIIGPEAFENEGNLREVARRTATDIGALNQLACVNARVVYVASGLDDAGQDRANRFGEAVYEEIQRLPESVSTPAKVFDPELRANIAALRSAPDFYRVYGGGDEGAVIVSQLEEAVEFHRSLSGRVANVVPLDDAADALNRVTAATQTVGIYPESLKTQLRDRLPLFGAQRLVSLGYAADASLAAPQDAIEPLRRMVKWIVDEQCDPEIVTPLWT